MKLTDFLLKVGQGDVDAVAAALDADPDLLDASGTNERVWHGSANALMVAAMTGQVAVIRLLLARGAYPKSVSESDVSPLAVAAVDGRAEVVRVLLDSGSPVDIFAACALGDEQRLSALLTENPGLVRTRAFDGKTPLHFCRTVDTARTLLAAGAELDAVDDETQTPLQWISATGRYQPLCRLLIAEGAQAQASDIFWACAYGDTDAVRRLLASDASLVNARRPAEVGVSSHMVGSTPLFEAAVRGDEALCRLLIDHHADVNARCAQNESTALHAAAAGGHLEVTRLLLAAGADPALKDGSFGGTPREWAVFFGHPELADLLGQSEA
jgi:ankyrin repeat protein